MTKITGTSKSVHSSPEYNYLAFGIRTYIHTYNGHIWAPRKLINKRSVLSISARSKRGDGMVMTSTFGFALKFPSQCPHKHSNTNIRNLLLKESIKSRSYCSNFKCIYLYIQTYRYVDKMNEWIGGDKCIDLTKFYSWLSFSHYILGVQMKFKLQGGILLDRHTWWNQRNGWMDATYLSSSVYIHI